jgi:hypothetical protein
MTSPAIRAQLRVLLTGALLCTAPFLMSACSSNEAKAKKVVQEYLQGQNPRDVQVDFFYVDRNHPDKSYVGVTATYNFATSKGDFQKEYLGYVLKQDGNGWAIERNVSYTKDQSRASALIEGGK